VWLQVRAESCAGARDARHDGADGQVKDSSDLLVLELFDVTEEKAIAQGRWELYERLLHDCGVVELKECGLRCGICVCCSFDLFGVLEEDRASGGDGGARGEEGVAQDAEDPRFEVGAGREGVEGTESLG